ncbi:hypothetical protein TVAG_185230 [Trichomonas vaginalis G3]|uniref:Uncharacterized protein n=1 Tax=Trichomonas vaginalis (strain ATCC PRA-98 / G3) TaxID=412133 RepID=A2D8G8_TRIV3|nr:hypothetical protein TVAGG3_0393170 [Trichomonas vaginalis G3]EAY23217.1 hypothetical protein TVAG_185230 [Trichomonas vaginalis G3]KAI5534134.1 hypothetical protein TVAGG3_0393170 [Trichomonas vaginalis G3]|eukprot:XP_001584203.1 hypothetical protein [Trichomonas vaginalis G3]
MLFQVCFSAISIYLVYYLHPKDYLRRFVFQAEKNHWIYLSLFVTSIYSLFILYGFYRQFPYKVPKEGKSLIELDHSAMMSLINGTNKNRISPFLLNNPMLLNETLNASPLPIAFTACLYQMHSDYIDISFIISFLNTISTVIALNILTASYINFPTIVTFLVLFHSSWGFIHFFRCRDTSIDLLHNIGKGYVTPIYQPFFKFLVCSKSASFAFPMAIYVIAIIATPEFGSGYYMMFLLAGFIASLIPSFAVSFSVFIICLCHVNSILFTFFFSISLVWKYFYSSLSIVPIWREYQYDGVFISQFWSWFDILGPFIISFILFPFMNLKPLLLHRVILTISPLILLSFIRSGGDHFDNALAITATVLPTAIIATVSFLNTIVSSLGKRMRGHITGICILFFIIFVVTGHISCVRQTQNVVDGVTKDAKSMASFIEMHISNSEAILTTPSSMNPVSFLVGHQIFVGDAFGHYQRGEDATQRLIQYNTMNLKQLMEMKKIKFVLFDLRQDNNYPTYENVTELLFRTENWLLLKLI